MCDLSHPSLVKGISLIGLTFPLAGCDPLVSLQGSFWPPWIIVMVAALPLTYLVHLYFKRIGIVDALRPSIVLYPVLWALLTFLTWLIAFPW